MDSHEQEQWTIFKMSIAACPWLIVHYVHRPLQQIIMQSLWFENDFLATM